MIITEKYVLLKKKSYIICEGLAVVPVYFTIGRFLFWTIVLMYYDY